MSSTEELAKAETQRQLQSRGFSVSRSERGNFEAYKQGRRLRIKVRGLKKPNAVWLKESDLASVDFVIVYVLDKRDVWVLSTDEAKKLLDQYQLEYERRYGRRPREEGFNRSQLSAPTGWERLDDINA